MLAQATIEKGALDSLILTGNALYYRAIDSIQDQPLLWLIAAIILCAVLLRPRNRI